jgi:hypothetical protein
MARLKDDVVGVTGGSSGTQLATAQRFVGMSACSAWYVSRVLRATPTLARVFDSATRRCRRLTTSLFDPYRPERHYMRGPGPKWREKQAPGAGRQTSRGDTP